MTTATKPVPRKAKAFLTPRLINSDSAKFIIGGRGVLDDCEAAGWIKPVRRGKHRTLWSFAAVQSCADRIEGGEYPGEGK